MPVAPLREQRRAEGEQRGGDDGVEHDTRAVHVLIENGDDDRTDGNARQHRKQCEEQVVERACAHPQPGSEDDDELGEHERDDPEDNLLGEEERYDGADHGENHGQTKEDIRLRNTRTVEVDGGAGREGDVERHGSMIVDACGQ